MEKENQELPSKSSQIVAEERNITPAQLHAFIAGVMHLVSEADAEKSGSRDATDGAPILSVEQMVSRLHHLAATVAPFQELDTQPRQLLPPSEDTQASDEPSRDQAAEKAEHDPDQGYPSGKTTEPEVIVGSLRTAQEDIWKCKVPSCTGSFHRL
jgi:hypothetical protein